MKILAVCFLVSSDLAHYTCGHLCIFTTSNSFGLVVSMPQRTLCSYVQYCLLSLGFNVAFYEQPDVLARAAVVEPSNPWEPLASSKTPQKEILCKW